MGRDSHADEGAPYILLVGGESQFRAVITYGAAAHGLCVEPVSTVSELRCADWQRADVIVAWHEFGTLGDLRNEMHRNEAWIPIVLCTETTTIPEIIRMLEGGASDIVEWPANWEHLAERIRLVLRNWQQHRPRQERAYRANRRLLELSKRELEVIEGIAAGLSNKDIAKELGISHRTVEIHRSNLLSKLRVGSTSEALGLYYQATLGCDGASQLELRLGQNLH